MGRLVAVRSLSSGAFFVLLPFLPRWLSSSDDIGPEQAGIVVGVVLLMTKVGGFLATAISARFGLTRPLPYLFVVAAVALGIGGTLGVGMAGWLLIACVAGTCFSNATALVKTIAAHQWPGNDIYVVFGYLSVAVNLAAGVGGAVGGLAASQNLSTPVLASVALGGAALASVGLPSIRAGLVPESTQVSEGSRCTPHRSQPLGPIVIGGVFVWVAYSQVYSVLPTFSDRWVAPSTVGAAFLVSSGLLICIQLPTTRWIRMRLEHRETASDSSTPYLGLAAVLMAASVAAILLVERTGAPALFVSVMLCAVAVVVWVPILDSEVARRHRYESLPTAYAVVGLIWGAAEAGGAWLGLRAVGRDTNGVGDSVVAQSFFASVAIGVAIVAAFLVVGTRTKSRMVLGWIRR